MTKSQSHSTWLRSIYQPKEFQGVIFTGFEMNSLSPMCIIINDFVDSIDLFFSMSITKPIGKQAEGLITIMERS